MSMKYVFIHEQRRIISPSPVYYQIEIVTERLNAHWSRAGIAVVQTEGCLNGSSRAGSQRGRKFPGLVVCGGGGKDRLQFLVRKGTRLVHLFPTVLSATNLIHANIC
ncbi:hypothetical protein CDAR_282841 [Caerostris darwini]|uniref:Uncharacterized protein n=1 Tax=Caerostris darwini TaxID=1538125 RepID=A0AAV4W6K0_9ARAC|nr:hypothetical protein CDAR_282841 [Caerostris darwini]